MEKGLLERLVNRCLDAGSDFSEIFYEDKIIKKYYFSDSKLDKINTNISKGVGIRISKDDSILYSSVNDLNEEKINQTIDQLNKTLKGKRIVPSVNLAEFKIPKNNGNNIAHNNFDAKKKKQYLYDIDRIARGYSDKIIQVEAMFFEIDQKVKIANSLGRYVEDTRMLTRLYICVIARDGNKTTNSYITFGCNGGYELLDSISLEEEVTKLAEAACKKLGADSCPGGDMPVIVGPGFGAVIIHEACGHALEATSVARNLSILGNKKGTKVANEKVTIVDDGTISNMWGTLDIDDEGNETRKNILIEKGILKGYLVDYFNSKKMNDNITGSGRRESYLYAPTSRMNNTYLLPGNDSVEDMIKSIDYGLYAKHMGGGSVDPVTGDFNFSVLEAYMIRNGEIAEMVNGASLIGNTLDILNKIEMVSDNLLLETGWCGSESGQVAVTCGQPTIKVSSILVGGDKND